MPIQNDLAAFRQDVSGCHAVAFADISTEMVLATDAADLIGQEVWDQIAAFAVAQLSGSNAAKTAEALGGTALNYAILSDQDEACIVITSQVDPDFAICGLASLSTDIGRFLSTGQDLVDRLAANA